MIPFLAPLSELASSVINTISSYVKDKQEQKKLLIQFQHQYAQTIAELQKSLLEDQSKIIIAEATGHSWLQRNWRPITMLVFVFIIANNYVLAPYAHAFGVNLPVLQMPDKVWEIIQYGLFGYIGARSVEKGVALMTQATVAKQLAKTTQPQINDEPKRVPRVSDFNLSLEDNE